MKRTCKADYGGPWPGWPDTLLMANGAIVGFKGYEGSKPNLGKRAKGRVSFLEGVEI